MNIREILAFNLKKIRESFGYTQAYVAEACGFEVPSYSRWENGKAWPNPETIEKLSVLFVCRPSYFYQDPEAEPSLSQSEIDKIATQASLHVLLSTVVERVDSLPLGLIDRTFFEKTTKETWGEIDEVLNQASFNKRHEMMKKLKESNPTAREDAKKYRLDQIESIKKMPNSSEEE